MARESNFRMFEGLRRIILLFLAALATSCGENTPDCFQATGDIVEDTVVVPEFTAITVFENSNLVLRQGDQQEVRIQTGAFLRNDISATVSDGRLLLRNENDCNFARDFGVTTFFVTAPNITEIRSSTGLLISSDGVLAYPNLDVISESFIDPEAQTTDGTFDLELDAQNVNVLSNGIAFFQIRGQTENLSIIIAAGDSRVDAENLVTQNVSMNHRGSNQLFVNPQERISGIIRGLGDVISINRPPEIEVEEIFDGRLIFRE